MSRRSRQARRRDKAQGAFLTAIGLVSIGALAAAIWLVPKPGVDSETNCPNTGPKGIHLILIDRSDPVSGQQAQRIRQIIGRDKTNAIAGTRFDIYTFEGDSKNEFRPILNICVPGRPEHANPIIQNPERIRKRYEERFAKVLDETISNLLQESTRPSSPILESLRAAVLTSFGALEIGQIPLRATLISDMVQHSAAVSHFRSEPNFDQLSKSKEWTALCPQFKGAEIDILYILRPSAMRGSTPIQNRGHQMFWERYIAACGGRLNRIEPL